MSRTARITAWIVAAMLAVVSTLPVLSAQDRRVALVVGNGLYQATDPLSNPRNDAKDLAASLQRLGFEVILVVDANKQEFERSLARFARAARGSDAAMIYYAGHALQYEGTNYLVPVDAHLDDEFSLNSDMVNLASVMSALDAAPGIKMLILDACRNNPLAERLLKGSSRGMSMPEGLAKSQASYGTLVAYSTQANKVAMDGEGRNSPFTKALLDQISVPGVEVLSMFRRVIEEVYKNTDQHQLPEVSLQLVGDFYFSPAPTVPKLEPSAKPEAPAVAVEEPVSAKPATAPVRTADISPPAKSADAPKPVVEPAKPPLVQHTPDPAASAPNVVTAPSPPVAQAVPVTPPNVSIAPRVAIASLSPPASKEPDLVPAIEGQLIRVGCLSGAATEPWTNSRTVRAVHAFDEHFDRPPDDLPTAALLTTLKNQSARVCFPPIRRVAAPKPRLAARAAIVTVARPVHRERPQQHCVEQSGQRFCF